MFYEKFQTMNVHLQSETCATLRIPQFTTSLRTQGNYDLP